MSNMNEITVRSMKKEDVEKAAKLCKIAFGTFFGMKDPENAFGDRDYITPRWTSPTCAFFVADKEGQSEPFGSVLISQLGSVSFLGPLSVKPDIWGQGIAHKLLTAAMDKAKQWGTPVGLFTFSNSAKHIHLYEKFGFRARFLTSVMEKKVQLADKPPSVHYEKFSQLQSQSKFLEESFELTNAILKGYDLRPEIQFLNKQKSQGDTILIRDGSELVGFAIVHFGFGTEAGSGCCFIKFAVVKPSSKASQHFDQLVHACESFAHEIKAEKVEAGVNMERYKAYCRMKALGFHAGLIGALMLTEHSSLWHEDVYALDDYR